MRVLFVNKYLGKNTIFRLPFGILYLAAAVKNRHQVYICEPKRENLDEVIKKFKPDIIAYSIRTGFHQYYVNLNERLKKNYDFIAIFGGPHATFFPEIINQPGIDIIGLGECEGSFLELLDKMERREDYRTTSNFWFKTPEGIVKNKLTPLEQNLDSLPFPDRSLLDHHDELKNLKIHCFFATRGCPYGCTYCFNHKFKELYSGQPYVRQRSVDNLLAEINQVRKNYDIERIIFEDDNFIMNKEWLREFAKKYPKIPFKCMIRANLTDEETIELLKQAGCISVTMGIEAGNDRISNQILKRNLTKQQLIDCAVLLKKHGLRFITENILANPTSTLANDLETLDLNIVCQPDFANVSLLNPYPSTEIFDIAVRAGEYQPHNFNDFSSFFDSTPLNLPDLDQRKNLQRLFSLTVAFPALRPWLPHLIRINSCRFLYSAAYSLWRPYCLMFKIMPHKVTMRELFWLIRRYLTD